MTDEEKAMTSFKKNICKVCEDCESCDISILSCSQFDMLYQIGYIEGLIEGRREHSVN